MSPLPTLWRAGRWLRRAALLLAAAAGPCLPVLAADGCEAGAVTCARSAGLAVGVTQFRAGNQGAAHWAQANLRLHNGGRTPLNLAYVDRSGELRDEHGNRYTVAPRGVHGIGVAERRRVDTSFVLGPGESAEVRIDFRWHRGRDGRTGLRFDMALALREVQPQPGGQVRLGREHALRWPGLTDGAAAATSATPAPPAHTDPRVADAGDACAGRAHCVVAGAFSTELLRLQPSPRRQNLNVVQVEFRVHNHGTTPLTLGYLRGSGRLIDDRGARYEVDWRRDGDVAGIGQVERREADPRFVLQPGEARPFVLRFSRYGEASGGSVFSADLVLAQLALLPGRQVQTEREHAIGFSGVAASAGGAAQAADVVRALQGLGALWKK